MFITRLQHVVLRRYTFPKPTRSPHILVTKPKISRAPVRTMAWRSHAESNEGMVSRYCMGIAVWNWLIVVVFGVEFGQVQIRN